MWVSWLIDVHFTDDYYTNVIIIKVSRIGKVSVALFLQLSDSVCDSAMDQCLHHRLLTGFELCDLLQWSDRKWQLKLFFVDFCEALIVINNGRMVVSCCSIKFIWFCCCSTMPVSLALSPCKFIYAVVTFVVGDSSILFLLVRVFSSCLFLISLVWQSLMLAE